MPDYMCQRCGIVVADEEDVCPLCGNPWLALKVGSSAPASAGDDPASDEEIDAPYCKVFGCSISLHPDGIWRCDVCGEEY